MKLTIEEQEKYSEMLKVFKKLPFKEKMEVIDALTADITEYDLKLAENWIKQHQKKFNSKN